MNNRFRSQIPLITLLLLAVISGIAWRAELELRGGWAGLTWVTYFHWAVPACVCAFLVWVVVVTHVQRRRAFATALLVFSVIAYEVVYYLFVACFGRQIIVVTDAAALERLQTRQLIMSCLLLMYWPLLPLAFCALSRWFGISLKVRPVMVSAALCMLSWPLANFLQSYLEKRGGQDFLHALKSGYIIPFLILSLGLPLLHSGRQKSPSSASGSVANRS